MAKTIIYSSREGAVFIGADTLIAAQCYIIDMDHGIESNKRIRNRNNIVGKAEIGEDVWIGAGVKILRNTKIED